MKYLFFLILLSIISCHDTIVATPPKNEIDDDSIPDIHIPIYDTAYIATDSLSFSSGMRKIHGKKQTFTMGEKDLMYYNSLWYVDETPPHSVTFTNDFYIDTTEVTVSNFASVMGLADTNSFKNTPQTNVSWYDAVLYCNERSKKDKLDTVYTYSSISLDTNNRMVINNIATRWNVIGYRLPTEAEWEYACRGGATTTYYWGDSYSDAVEYAWYKENSTSQLHDVASKKPNGFGLYDMAGNVFEWCNDNYSTMAGLHIGDFYNYGADATDPTGANGKYAMRVLRGGSYTVTLIAYHSDYFASAWRNGNYPEKKFYDSGFRVVLPDLPIIFEKK